MNFWIEDNHPILTMEKNGQTIIVDGLQRFTFLEEEDQIDGNEV